MPNKTLENVWYDGLSIFCGTIILILAFWIECHVPHILDKTSFKNIGKKILLATFMVFWQSSGFIKAYIDKRNATTLTTSTTLTSIQ
jgi:hypothetical protein